MERLDVRFDAGVEFEQLLADSLPDGGDIRVISKDNATVEGNPAVMIAFTVQLPDGTTKIAQTVTTMKLFLTSVRAMEARYGYLLK